ncbi:MAG: His/Gly/Thr/Pro-type tRNA ligase C-terminal domain-containing protein, partial [Candidatus Adiutrix sp.]
TKMKVLGDLGVKALNHGVVGAGEMDMHYLDATCNRDFTVDKWLDLAQTTEGDPCPRCGAPLSIKRGIEVGHIFKLGLKYSQSMNATYTQPSGDDAPLVMGCYGIGVGRTVAAAIEQNHDEGGIMWPMALAPYEVVILPLQVQNEEVMAKATTLFTQLMANNVETVLDDRDERPGVKFKDSDLIGYPLRVTVSAKSLAEGKVELKCRQTREVFMLNIDDAALSILEMKKAALKSCTPPSNT